MRIPDYITNQKSFLSKVVDKRHLSSVVGITLHFAKRFLDRKVELDGYKCFNLALDNICRIIYEFEMGNKPYCMFNKIRINFKRDEETKIIIFTSIYEDSSRNKKGVFV